MNRNYNFSCITNLIECNAVGKMKTGIHYILY